VNVLHIAWRELRASFTTATGWLVLCGWLLISGLFWVLMVQTYVVQSQDLVFDPYTASMLNLTDFLLTPFFGNLAVILIFLSPALTMRLFAEEYKQRTMELLFTSPVSTLQIVLGKYLGAMAFVGVMLLGTLQFPLGLMQWGDPDWGVVAGGYLALALLASALMAMGTWFSSLTDNQIVALVLTFVTGLGLWIVSWGARDPNDWMAQLSITTHLEDLARGAVRLSDVAYYLGLTGFFLVATHQRMESFRWR
jgi:ABC-2 type transport system permease protein